MRTFTKKFRAAAAAKDAATVKEMLPKITQLLQKLAQKGIIHKNQASRRVSRLHKLVNASA